MKIRNLIAASILVGTLAGCSANTNGTQEDPPQEPIDGAATLNAIVGTGENPDAFEISLQDAEGNPVTAIIAGAYQINVTDQTSIHNFHLQGLDTEINEETGVGEKTNTTWNVTLEAGEYRYLCDPHPSMSGTFTVD